MKTEGYDILGMEPIDEVRFNRLPKWARDYIVQLQSRVLGAEATLPWTEPGMQWTTLLKDSDEETLFLCDRSGTHPIATVGKGDRVFLGRAHVRQQ
jgi:hypothetical protein